MSFILCDFVTLNTIFLFSVFLLRAYRPGLTAVDDDVDDDDVDDGDDNDDLALGSL